MQSPARCAARRQDRELNRMGPKSAPSSSPARPTKPAVPTLRLAGPAPPSRSLPSWIVFTKAIAAEDGVASLSRRLLRLHTFCVPWLIALANLPSLSKSLLGRCGNSLSILTSRIQREVGGVNGQAIPNLPTVSVALQPYHVTAISLAGPCVRDAWIVAEKC